MRYLSLFSGIEAVTQAWKPLGYEAVAFSEIELFPCAVLDHYYPDVPNLGDITKITETQIKKLGHIDIVVFGSPCQDLSIAGKREGLDGERSGLFKTAIKIIKWCRKHCGTEIVLWENVPGAFSSNGGKDFAEVIRLFTGAKFAPQKWRNSGVCITKECEMSWRVIDAQYFGVPQRRRRIFAIADFSGRCREPILFESEGVCRDITESREKRQDFTETAGTLAASCAGLNRPSGNGNQADFCIVEGQQCFDKQRIGVYGDGNKSSTLSARDYKDATECARDYKGVGNQFVNEGKVIVQHHAVAYNFDSISSNSMKSKNPVSGCNEVDTSITITATQQCPSNNRGGMGINEKSGVRRLTPIECEKLQGFPVDFTKIPYKGKPAEECPDTPRYKALGNSMAAPVVRWLGKRIKECYP